MNAAFSCKVCTCLIRSVSVNLKYQRFVLPEACHTLIEGFRLWLYIKDERNFLSFSFCSNSQTLDAFKSNSASSWSDSTEQDCAFWRFAHTRFCCVNDVIVTQGWMQHIGGEMCGCPVFKCHFKAFSGLRTIFLCRNWIWTWLVISVHFFLPKNVSGYNTEVLQKC